VVRERHVGSDALGHLADGLDVAREVVLELLLGEIREALGLEPDVAVGHVDREHAADRRPVRGDPDRLADRTDTQCSGIPVADRIHEGALGGITVLAEEMDRRPETGHRCGQSCVVHVGAGAIEQVAVEDEDVDVEHRISKVDLVAQVATP
jgi:hypothetical protein